MCTNQVLESTETTETGGSEIQDKKDDVFHTLSNRRRRYVLTYLHTNGSYTTVREISEELAAWENGISRAEVTYKQRKRTYTSLIQIHLGTLDDGGFVEYDADRGEIELTDDGTYLARLLDENLVVSAREDDEPEDGLIRGLYRRLDPRRD